MRPSEVKHYLQEVRANLKKSVDLMERQRPGDSDRTRNIQIHLSGVLLCIFCVLSECGSPLLPPEEALKLLRRTQRHSGLIMAETQPLRGELEDATARAYAAMGESWSFQVCAYVKCLLQLWVACVIAAVDG